jgi:hypothetical protein
LYRGDVNDPTITAAERSFLAEKNENENVRQQQQQQQLNNIVKLEVNQPRPPPRPQGIKGIEPLSFLPSFTTNPFVPPQFANQMSFTNPVVTTFGPEGYGAININKVYDIQVGGPATSHAAVNMVYENLVGPKNVVSTFKSLSERLFQYENVRGMLFNKGDGTPTNFTGSGNNSILSYIKFLKLNPYNNYRFSDNPYKGLPEGFLIYNSCYPIRRGNNSNAICSRDSINLNVRIYKMNQGAFNVSKQNLIKTYDYDQWREVSFYEYIREFILKKKVCPNFLFAYGYYLTDDSKIDFDKLNNLASVPDKSKNILSIIETNIRSIYEQSNPAPQPNQSKQTTLNPQSFISSLKSINPAITTITSAPLPKIDKKDLDKYNGEVLTLLTEGPTYYFFDWLVDRTANQGVTGNVVMQISIGNKKSEVWYSVLFQLMAALLTLQCHGIYIANFNIERNVFIKELGNDGIATNFWKYRIDGIDYYVPNYGYVVIIDSDYKDLDSIQNLQLSISNPTLSGPSSTGKYKLDGTIFGKEPVATSGAMISGNSIQQKDILNKIFNDMFLKVFDDNIFTKSDYEQRGYAKPPTDILIMLGKIHTENVPNISNIIKKYMWRYMNNRIGTYLKEQEQIHVRSDATKEFIQGQMVVYTDSEDGAYRFVLFDSISNPDTGECNVLSRMILQSNPTTDDIYSTSIETITVNKVALSIYSKAEPIQQQFKAGEAILSEENLIETYTIVI